MTRAKILVTAVLVTAVMSFGQTPAPVENAAGAPVTVLNALRFYNCPPQGTMHDMGEGDSNACGWEHATFDSQANATYGSQALRFQTLNSFGPSYNYSGIWRVVSMNEQHQTMSNRGIANGFNIYYRKNAAGDSNLHNIYAWFDGGYNSQSDEGFTGIRGTFIQNPTYWHGRSLSSGTGLTLPLLVTTPTAPTSGEDNDHTTDGGILVDISKGIVSGTVTGEGVPLPGSGYLRMYPTAVAGGLPRTTAWGVCPQAIPVPGAPAEGGEFTCVVQLQAGVFQAGGLVWVAGPNYPEQAPITAVSAPSGGTQSITIFIRNPQTTPGANIFQGGLVGQYLSLDANLASTGIRSTYYAFGSPDGTNLIYGFFRAGTSSLMPEPGKQAFAPGVAGRNGFHLYPGAEVVANLSVGHDPQLEPNAMVFSTGDVMEAPPPVAGYMTGLKMLCSMAVVPNESVCDSVVIGGSGAVSDMVARFTLNTNPAPLYKANGGTYDGMAMHRIRGYFDEGDLYDIAPANGVFKVLNMNFMQAGGDHSLGNNRGRLFSMPRGDVWWYDDTRTLYTENLGSATYLGPATAPSGDCTVQQTGLWEFSQDGHASWCSATATSPGKWITKL